MKKYRILTLGLLTGAALALPVLSNAAINKGIEGSAHDFATNSWNSRQGICSPCHSAHNTDTAQVAPLWNHATSVGPFNPYSSPTLKASVGQPDGASLACLSCHDGTLAINQAIGGVTNASSQFIDPSFKIGPDLHVVHPISFTYNSALAQVDNQIEDPSLYTIGSPKDATKLTVNVAPVPATWSGTSLTGKTIKAALLTNDKVQCTSCHDVHKMEGSAPESGILVKISGTDSTGRGSLICRTCHIK